MCPLTEGVHPSGGESEIPDDVWECAFSCSCVCAWESGGNIAPRGG
jgi:hypothetical protein